MRLALIASGAAAVASCTLQSRWADLRVDAYGSYGGRLVSGSTLWHVRTKQTFPPGANIEAHGFALAIPLGNDRYVYGLMRALDTDSDFLDEWTHFITGLDGFARDEETRQHAGPAGEGNFSEAHNRHIKRLAGREIPFCLPPDRSRPVQHRCIVFVYVGNPDDPKSVMLVRPGQVADLGGKRFVLERVTATYQEPGQSSRSTEAMLPRFVRDEHVPCCGMLPPHLYLESDRPLRRGDFDTSLIGRGPAKPRDH
ncbi:hypothetical protein [Sphingomonas sp. Leaf412]|uniref:hypothetical protein n=1 Tax=Sphingomonas sp. Leaf412 TaxID=1736370 RepID=UPI001F3F3182|nr:hypothetical protein [Sphingomonas sp. Leaf412]